MSPHPRPKSAPHPLALDVLAAHGHPVEGLRSKSWEVFAQADAPRLDGVITVCDSAAAEACPIWPGAPVSAHWGLPDPAGISDPTEARAAFEATYDALRRRIERVVAAPDLARPEALKAALIAAHEEADQ